MRLISADELKEWIEAWFNMNKYYHPYSKRETIPTVELFDILDRVPKIDPVKHGTWIFSEGEYGTEARCSVCGDEYTGEAIDWIGDYFNYCPNCGAFMRGKK